MDEFDWSAQVFGWRASLWVGDGGWRGGRKRRRNAKQGGRAKNGGQGGGGNANGVCENAFTCVLLLAGDFRPRAPVWCVGGYRTRHFPLHSSWVLYAPSMCVHEVLDVFGRTYVFDSRLPREGGAGRHVWFALFGLAIPSTRIYVGMWCC